jgi:SpoVK/Ycf46/Vps4 family AAA+-type ATPase
MQKKCLDFLQNFLNNYNDYILYNGVFNLLWSEDMQKLLASHVQKTVPKTILKRVKADGERNHCYFDLKDGSPMDALVCLWNNQATRLNIKNFLPKLVENARKTSWSDRKKVDVFHDKMMEIQRTLKLTDNEIDLLLVGIAQAEGFLIVPQTIMPFEKETKAIQFFAQCLNLEPEVVQRLTASKMPLRRYECLDEQWKFHENSGIGAFINGINNEPLSSCFFHKDNEETLPWSDFAELGKNHGSILKKMLTSSDKPVNILLYGAPGTGKTSFAKTLVKESGRTSYSIAQDVHVSGKLVNASNDFRFAAIDVCNSLVCPEESVIIVDEADNMLSASGGDKGLLNTVLDRAKTSTIWIANTTARALDPSSRRRFDYSICFKPLTNEQRKRIWKNTVTRMHLGRLITSQQIESFSSLYPVSAGGISMTLENLSKLHPRKSDVATLVEQLMKQHCELMEISQPNSNDEKPQLASKDYSLEGLNINGDFKLERIVEAVRTFQQQKATNDPDRPRMNLLLTGAPGTGKTEFVKYLGDVLNTKITVRMGSDLLGQYVGVTEKNIAAAFREAEAEHAILFLDEIDGLVQERSNSDYSWEVTRVNELLHQMENFNGVMVGATNFLQNLDPAIMRRFTFKLQFNYLDDRGKRLFFERMFKSQLTDEELVRLNAIKNLAPGDFRTVRQSLLYYGGDVTNAQRLAALEIESAAKSGKAFTSRERIGF